MKYIVGVLLLLLVSGIVSFNRSPGSELNSIKRTSDNYRTSLRSSPSQDTSILNKAVKILKVNNILEDSKLIIDNAIFDDTLRLDYKKVKRNGKLSKWRKGQVWVNGNIYKKSEVKSQLKQFGYINVHEAQLNYYLNGFLDATGYRSEQQWTRIQKVELGGRGDIKFDSVSRKKFIYGFHPYWMGDMYRHYNFKLYNRIGYYGYIINSKDGSDKSTGIDINAHAWCNSDIHKLAKKDNCPVDLCVASYSLEENTKIFSDSLEGKNLRRKLVSNILFLMEEKGDGICFDIQKVPLSLKKNYINLIQTISDSIRSKTNKNNQFNITVILPRNDIEFPYNMSYQDYVEMSFYVDRWILTGDSFDESVVEDMEVTEKAIGSCWDIQRIDQEINRYPAELFNKMLLEIPLYDSRRVFNGKDTVPVISQFRELIQLNPNNSDPIQKRIREDLKQKLEYTNLKRLQGIAVWATGYDHQTDLANILTKYTEDMDFNVDESIKVMLNNIIVNNEALIDSLDVESDFVPNPDLASIEFPKSNPMNYWDKIISGKIEIYYVIIFCLTILLFFVILGVIISLFYESAREVLFSREYVVNIGMAVFILSLIILLERFDVIEDVGLVFSLGIGLGILVTWMLSKKRAKKESEVTP